AVADHRHRFLAEAREHELASLAVRQDLPAHGIDDLGIEVVLPDMKTVLAFHALVGDAWPHHFRQAVNVDGMHVAGLLDLLTHAVGPRLGPEDADFERGAARIDTLPSE